MSAGEEKNGARGEKEPAGKICGDAPVSMGEETIGVRMVMFRVSLVSRSTASAAKLM